MNKNRLFSVKEMLKVTEETNQRVQYWIMNGIVTPHEPNPGIGKGRQYSFENLLEILIAQSLMHANFHVQLLTNVFKQIRREHRNYFKDTTYSNDINNQYMLSLIIVGPSTSSCVSIIHTFEDAQEHAAGLHRPGTLLIQLNLDLLKEHLMRKLEKMEKKA